MKDCREKWFDEETKTSVLIADVSGAAQALARGHLSGPVAAYHLARALAAAACLGAETSEKDESLSIQMKCSGPLGGLNVECTSEGKLRGYTGKKILPDLDGMVEPAKADATGETALQITRTVPGRILSSGVASSLDDYLSQSLQRKARMFIEASVSDEPEILEARAVLVESMPDGTFDIASLPKPRKGALAKSSRAILKDLGFPRAVLKETSPLAFGCRCSPERAASMLSALGPEERKDLPPVVDVVCHMCGKIYSVTC